MTLWDNIYVNYSGIQSKVYFLTKTNVGNFTNADMAILASNALERVQSLIDSSDGRWEFDDSNQTDISIGTTALVNAQQDYTLSVSFINIERVEVKNTDGKWSKLIPIDQADIYDQSLTDFLSGGGTPVYYDKMGNSMMLYPVPNYAQAASLKIFYQRPPVQVLTTDISSTATSPGFNSLYHDLIAYWVAYDYAMANGLPNANQFMVEIQRKEDALKEDYALRSKDEHIRLSARKIRNQFR